MASSAPPVPTYEEIASLIDHTLLDPHLSDDEIVNGCQLARAYSVASVTVRPIDVDLAVRQLRGSSVKVNAAVSYPHGHSTTAAKQYEARDLLRRGAQEIEVVLSPAKLRSRQFPYLETELLQLQGACAEKGALLKVVIEMASLPEDLQLIGLRLCKRTEVALLVTGSEHAGASRVDDLPRLQPYQGDRVGFKAAGGIATLEQVQTWRAAGCVRIGTTQTAGILDAWRAELAKAAAAPLPT